MALDISDWIELGKKYSMGYASWFLGIVTAPWNLVTNPTMQRIEGDEGSAESKRFGDLAIFLVISIFLGATIGAIIPDRPPLKDRTTVFVVVSLLWVFIGWLIHFICRLLRGKGTLTSTLSVMLQVLAMVYPISNFATLLIFSAKQTYQVAKLLPIELLVLEPGTVLVSLQFLALLFYIPAALAGIHQFRKVALIFVAIFSALCSLALSLPIAMAGGCYWSGFDDSTKLPVTVDHR